MRSHRDSGLGGFGIGAAFVLAMAIAPTAHAQPGFGPDPFWPYNRQYAPYTSPMGSADPMGGGNEGWMRQGYRGANQFQNYLEGLAGPGPGRLATDRAGIGMPGYRTAVDPTWGGGDFRRYQPNTRTTPTFQENQRQITDTYFAYLSERDPKKRVAMLRQHRQVRRASERLLSSGGAASPSQVLDSASGTSRGPTSLRGSGTAAPAEDRSPSPARARTTSPRPAAPPIPYVGSSRTGDRSRTLPSRVLERAGSMDDRDTPDSTSTTPRRRRPRTPVPPPQD